MNENVIVKDYEFNNPLIQKIDSIIDNPLKDCHDRYFHTFDHICENYLNFTNIPNNKTVNFTISDKSMGLFELNKKLTLARERGFKFNQINKLAIKIYKIPLDIIIHYHPKIGTAPLHRQFFIKTSENRDYIKTFCNDRRNTFHFACHQWYSYNDPQCNMVKLHEFVYK